MTRFALSITTAAIVCIGTMCVRTTPSHAQTFGDAPWCAVISLGDGDVEWDCEYRTVEECVPNVLAGNRGFCNVNPYWKPPQARPASVVRRKRHNQQQ